MLEKIILCIVFSVILGGSTYSAWYNIKRKRYGLVVISVLLIVMTIIAGTITIAI